MKRLKIIFANLNGNLCADGSRILSALLKEMGHEVRMVFLIERDQEHYSDHTVDQFVELSAGADLIMFSFLSDSFLRAARITRKVRERLNIPVIWGGLHATIAPEACMEYVDILCRGEGDEALPEFVEAFAAGKPIHEIPNFWVRRNGVIHRNEIRPLFQDLDRNPWPDYVLENHFVRDSDDRIKALTMDLMAQYHSMVPLGFYSYSVTSTRGCAQQCSYCYNATFKQMFPRQCRIRFRSLEDVVREIRSILDRYPFFLSFSFMDDDFFLRPLKQLEEFADLLREHLGDVIARTFWSAAITPASLSLEKLQVMKPVGLRTITIGVQTGSERLNRDVYNRRFKNALFLEKAELLDRHFHRELIILLDLIVNCPYETDDDHMETVKLLMKMPEWFMMNLYRFTFYPGAPIYERAIQEGIIDQSPELYSAINFWPFYYKGYPFMIHVMFLVASTNFILPDWLKKLLISRPIRFLSRMIPQKVLDWIDWDSLYRKLWTKNQLAIYKGRELKHH